MNDLVETTDIVKGLRAEIAKLRADNIALHVCLRDYELQITRLLKERDDE